VPLFNIVYQVYNNFHWRVTLNLNILSRTWHFGGCQSNIPRRKGGYSVHFHTRLPSLDLLPFHILLLKISTLLHTQCLKLVKSLRSYIIILPNTCRLLKDPFPIPVAKKGTLFWAEYSGIVNYWKYPPSPLGQIHCDDVCYLVYPVKFQNQKKEHTYTLYAL